jgi:hypothetical protein
MNFKECAPLLPGFDKACFKTTSATDCIAHICKGKHGDNKDKTLTKLFTKLLDVKVQNNVKIETLKDRCYKQLKARNIKDKKIKKEADAAKLKYEQYLKAKQQKATQSPTPTKEPIKKPSKEPEKVPVEIKKEGDKKPETIGQTVVELRLQLQKEELQKAEKAAKDSENNLAALENKLSLNQRELATLSQTITTLEQQVHQGQKEAQKKLQSELQKRQTLEQTLSTLQNEKNSVEREQNRAIKSALLAHQAYTQSDTELNSLKVEHQETTKKLTTTQEQLSQAQKLNAGKDTEISTLKNQKATLEQQLQNSTQAKDKEIARRNVTIQELRCKLLQEMLAVKDQKSQAEAESQKVQRAATRILELQSHCTQIVQENLAIKTKNQEARDALQKAQSDYQTLLTRLNQQEEQLKKQATAPAQASTTPLVKKTETPKTPTEEILKQPQQSTPPQQEPPAQTLTHIERPRNLGRKKQITSTTPFTFPSKKTEPVVQTQQTKKEETKPVAQAQQTKKKEAQPTTKYNFRDRKKVNYKA